jgi:hypothetical protein
LLFVPLGILPETPAKNSGFCGGAKISIGKSNPSKKSHGLRFASSSHSSGTQKPLDSTVKFTILNNFIIVNKPIVTFTAIGSELPSSQRLWQYLISASSATAFASTRMNGSASKVFEPLLPANKSVDITKSESIEPNKVTFLLYMLLALIEPIGEPSASLNVNLYSNTYLISISQNPFLNGFGCLSTTIIFLILILSIVTAAAFDGGTIMSPSLMCWSPRQIHSADLAGPIWSAVKQSCCLQCRLVLHKLRCIKNNI